MKIPKGVPDPGRVARKLTEQVGGTPPSKTDPPGQKSAEGLHSSPTPPSSQSTGGLMLKALMQAQTTAQAEARSNRLAKAEAHSTKIGMKEEQKAQTAKQQEAERNAAWTNVAIAVASAGAGAAQAGVKAAVTGASAAPAALQQLAIGQRKALVDTIGAVKQGATDAAKAAFEKVADGAMPQDINSLVQHVLRESYMETNKDLAFYADKVKHFNDMKQSVRDQIGQARVGTADPDALIKTLEEKLATVGDDAQLANIDLQSALQRQQQTLQLMSNVAKTLHDTGMAVIRKIG